MKKKKNNSYIAMLPYLILAIVLIVTMVLMDLGKNEVHNFTTGELMKEIDKNTITEITITPKSSENVYYVEGKLKSYSKNESFKSKVITEEIDKVTEYVDNNKKVKKYETNKDPGSNELVYIIVNTAKNVLEQTPPELSADIIDKGIVITGGGALIKGFDELLAHELKVPVFVAESPLTCVAEGTGILLDNIHLIDK